MKTSAPNQSNAWHDPRGRGFRVRTSVAEAVAWVDSHSEQPIESEMLAIRAAAGRVLAEDIAATRMVPQFDRAAMDGFAVCGDDTFGATPDAPMELDVIGTARPARAFGGIVRRGCAVDITTGSPMPNGADTVVPVEATRISRGRLCVAESFPPGRNVGLAGEDVRIGEQVLVARRVLRPQDVGLLAACISESEIPVIRRPRVGILVTGDEVGGLDSPGRIPDMNGPMLAALAARDGGRIAIGAEFSTPDWDSRFVADDPEDLRERMRSAIAECDVVLVSGGSSTGPEDHAPAILDAEGELAIHGLALRPASPAGMGVAGRCLVFLLPGNPVSCLCAYDLFAGRAIRRLGGRESQWPYGSIECELAERVVSALGRTDYVRVELAAPGRVQPIAVSGASILSSTTRAWGFLIVPSESEGSPAGARVGVWRYDLADDPPSAEPR